MGRREECDRSNAADTTCASARSISAIPATFGNLRWRTAVLGTVAAGALLTGYGRSAIAGPDACGTGGAVATCQGDQSDGITSASDFNPAVITTLNVNTLTEDIAPAAGVDGIEFTSTNAVTIISDTTDGPGGPFEITATGAGSRGINAFSSAGAVTVVSTGNVTADSHAIFVQGFSVINVTSTGNITSENGFGIFAQSFSTTVTVISDGNIDAGLDGIFAHGINAVNVDSTGDITSATGAGIDAFTFNDGVDITSIGDIKANDQGIYALSIVGSVAIDSTGDITSADDDGIYARAVGNAVNVTSSGNIAASGHGIYAQGDQAVSVTSTGDITSANEDGIFAFSDNNAATVTSAGNITASDNAIYARGNQAVNVTSIGNLTSSTLNGVFAQSLSGTTTVTSTGNIVASGEGLEARGGLGTRVTSTGNITSANDQGIFALSTAGTVDVASIGNIVANTQGIFARGTQAVNVASTGNITSATDQGIFARSASSTVDVTTSGGTVTGATDGVYTYSGTSSVTINNLSGGTITGDAFAIRSVSMTGTAINNAGTVTGNVDLTGGVNSFNNNAGGIFNSGATVNLGAGNALLNRGTLAPGGTGTVQTTALTGNIVQTGGGTLAVDVDMAAKTADRINVTGTAKLAGAVDPTLTNLVLGAQKHTILSAAGGTTNSGLALGPTGLALEAELFFPNANDVVLEVSIDFTPTGIGLNPNQTSIANNLNSALSGGGGTLTPIFDGLLNVFNITDYKDALNELLPEVYLNTETATLFSAEEFSNNLMSCPVAGEGLSVISEGECMWVRPEGRFLSQDGTSNYIGYDDDVYGVSGGGQVALAPNWFAGLAASYEDSSLKTDTNATSKSERYAAGGVIKYQGGPVLLALSGAAGTAGYDTRRQMSFGGFTATPSSNHDVTYLASMFRAAYLMDQGTWYAKPLIDANVTNVDRDDIHETGGGAANLNISGSDETFFSITPALELGADFDRGNGLTIRPYVRGGVAFYNDANPTLMASFAGAPGGTPSFRIASEFDDTFADIEAGLTVLRGVETSLSIGYEGRISDDTQIHGGFVKGTMKF